MNPLAYYYYPSTPPVFLRDFAYPNSSPVLLPDPMRAERGNINKTTASTFAEYVCPRSHSIVRRLDENEECRIF